MSLSMLTDEGLVAKLADLDGSGQDATVYVQEAYDRGLASLQGVFHVRLPLRVGGIEHYNDDPTPDEPDTSGLLKNLRATFIDLGPG